MNRPLALLGVFLAATLALPGDGTRRGFPEEVRGIILSTHLDGRDWAWDGVPPTLDEIRGVGAGWVAIHPYARVGRDGSLRVPAIDREHPPQSIVRPIREAHARGLKILIKPHLAYWGSPFSWRGEISYESAVEWTRFWRAYEGWIVELAAISGEADGFVVGTELALTLDQPKRWRRLIKRVREVTDVPLTYAANWDRFEQVTFWDRLDAIGIQAYFPLADAPTGDEATIRNGWANVMARLRTYSETQGKPILFTELGYNRSLAAAARPWDYATDGPEAETVQQACLRAALNAVRDEPSVVGVFLWKWFPQPHPVGRTFQLATPEVQALIRDAWAD